jgi:hypothetical protein
VRQGKRLAVLLGLAALLSAGCAWFHVLQQGSDGLYRVTGREYAIAPLPDGELLPPGWHPREAKSGYGEVDPSPWRFAKSDERDLDFGRDVDDGVLIFFAGRIQDHDTPHTMRELAVEAATASVQSNGFVSPAMSTAAPRAIDGGEACELTIATTVTASGDPLLRFYFFIFRKTGSDEVTVLRYGNSPSAFAVGMPDVTALTQRISFAKAATP